MTSTEVLASLTDFSADYMREYVIFDDGDGPQIWIHDKTYGVIESLPPAPENPVLNYYLDADRQGPPL